MSDLITINYQWTGIKQNSWFLIISDSIIMSIDDILVERVH